LIDLEYLKTRSDSRPALGKRIEARTQDNVLADTAFNFFRDQILDKPSAYNDSCPVASHGDSLHVRTVPPSFFGSCQLEADLVFY
jgi:hypothetical protein